MTTLLTIIASLFLPTSLLLVFYAPTNLLWKVAVLVGSIGHWIGLSILLAIVFIPGSLVIKLILLLTSVIFLYPFFYSFWIAKSLRENLDKAFEKPSSAFKECYINLSCVFIGQKKPAINVKSHIYKSEGGTMLSMDIYSDAIKRSMKPCIVVIHGGSWSSGNCKDLPDLNYHLANKGYLVAAVSYRLAPEFHFQDQLNDILSSIDYLKKNAIELCIDVNNIFVLGRSAGGQLAQITGFKLGKDLIKGIIAFYTPADLVWGYANPASLLVHNSREVLENYIGGTFDQKEAEYYAASPVYADLKNSPPVLMLHGNLDVLVAFGHNERLIPKLNENQIPNYLLSIPWATHGFDYFFNNPAAQLSTYAVEHFLHRYTVIETLDFRY